MISREALLEAVVSFHKWDPVRSIQVSLECASKRDSRNWSFCLLLRFWCNSSSWPCHDVLSYHKHKIVEQLIIDKIFKIHEPKCMLLCITSFCRSFYNTERTLTQLSISLLIHLYHPVMISNYSRKWFKNK